VRRAGEHRQKKQLGDAIHLESQRKRRESPVGNGKTVRAGRDIQKRQRDFDNEETNRDPLMQRDRETEASEIKMSAAISGKKIGARRIQSGMRQIQWSECVLQMV